MASLSESVIRSALSQPSLGRALLMQDITNLNRIERQKKDLLGNPKKIDDIVAMAAAEFSPMTKKVKDFAKYASKADAVDAAIPDDHPLKGYSQQLKIAYNQALGSREFKGVTAGEILQTASRGMLVQPDPKTGRSKLEGAFKYKRVVDADFWQWGDEDPDYRKLPGYDLWHKAVREAEDEDLASEAWFADIDDYKTAALWGAGAGALFGAFTGGPPGAITVGAGSAAIGTLLETVAHPLRRAMQGTEWYRSKMHSDETYEKVKAIGGGIAVELGFAVASTGIAAKSIRTALTRAAEAGRISTESLERFHVTGRAMDAVKAGQATRDERLAHDALVKTYGTMTRDSAYDSALAALDAATAPPAAVVGRQSFADVVSAIRSRKVGELLTRQEELARAGVSPEKISDATAFELSRIRRRFSRIDKKAKGPAEPPVTPKPKRKTKSPKKKFNQLSDKGAAKALDKGAKTGDLDKAIVETHADEQVIKAVTKTEESDYAKIVAGKKKAGRPVAKTDKARVVLQRAGYSAEQISALDSKKVVRLAKKVRAERAATRTTLDKTVKQETLEAAGEPKLVDVTEEIRIPGEEPVTPGTKVKIARTSEEVIRAEEEATGATLSNIQRLKLVHANMMMKSAAKQVDAMHTGRPDDATAKKLAGIGEELVPSKDLRIAEVPPARGQGIRGEQIEFANVPEAELATLDFRIDKMENVFLKKFGKDYLKWWDAKVAGGTPDIPKDRLKALEKEWTRLKKKYGDFSKLTHENRRAVIVWAREQGLAGIQTEEGIIKLRSFFDGANLPKLMLAGLLGVPILSLLSPKEANAAGLDTIGKTIPRVVGVLGKRASKADVKVEIHKIMKELDDLGKTSEAMGAGQKFLPRMQEQLDVDQMVIEELGNLQKAVTRRKNLPLSADRITDPATFSNMFYATGHGPAVQLATAQNAWGNNSLAGLQTLKNILAEVPGFRPMGRTISKAYDDLSARYGTVQAARTVEIRIDQLKGNIDDAFRNISGKRVGPKTLDREEKVISDAEAQINVLQGELDDLMPEVNAFKNDWTETSRGLAKEHSTVRMALAAEDTADFKYYPWLKGTLSYEEETAVAHIKNMMEEYAVRHLELGHKVIEERPFMHHAFHPKYASKRAGEVLDRIGVDMSAAIPFTKLFKRTKYSFQMVPDINYNLTRYIPDAERRIQMTRFWYGPTGRKGAKNTWYNHSRSQTVQGSEALSAFWKRLETAYTPFERTGWNVWANRYAAFETFMLIGFAPATAFKHVFKNIGTWGQLGFRNAASHAPEAFTTATRNYVNSPEVQSGLIVRGLKALGLKHKARRKFMDEYVKSYTHQFRMLSASMDLELATPRGFGVWDYFDRLLYRANEKGSILIRGVESFDRSHSMHAALDMAARMSLGNRGMTAKQAAYGIMDTILKNNFLGAGLNPRWMHNPVIRATLLFQNTPFKILERRLVNASYAAKDIKTAAGVIKAQDIPTTLRELADLKNYIFRGESLLKQNLIADAFTQSRDFFGTPYTKQFFREFMFGGMVVWGLGGVMDADFMPHTFHLPFLSTFGGDKPQLATSPMVGAGFKILQGWMHPSDRAEQDEFWMTEFMKDWLGKKQLIPQTAHKVLRMSDNDIPDIYEGSKLAYLFSVPAKH